MAGIWRLCAKRVREPIVAAAADRGQLRAAGGKCLENEAGVIVEIAGEAGAEMEFCGIAPLPRDQAEPGIETVEDSGQIERCAGRKRAEPDRCVARIALDLEKFFDDRALLLGESGTCLERCLLQEAIGDLPGGAAARRGDAGDREKVLDERTGALLVGAFEHAEDAGMIGAVHPQAQNLVESFALRMAACDAAAPLGRQVEGFEQL